MSPLKVAMRFNTNCHGDVCHGISSSMPHIYISHIIVLYCMNEGLFDLVRRDELARVPACFLRWGAQHL